MSAKDFIRSNKTTIQLILAGNRQLILDKCYEKDMVTELDHINLSSINRGTEMEHVTQLINNIMGKGEKRCKEFLDLLQQDKDIKEAFPQLEEILVNYTPSLPKPTQESSSTAKTDDVGQDTKPEPKKDVDELDPLKSKPTGLCFINNMNIGDEEKTRRGSDANAIANAEAISRPIAVLDETEYYALTHNPRGWCVIINIENYTGLPNRRATQMDTKALTEVFIRLGFKVVINNDLTADQIRTKLQNLGRENFLDHDALVVCVLSRGEKGVVFGSDERTVPLEELTRPFTSDRAPTLAGKPKLFFIDSCQGDGYQRGAVFCPPQPRQEEFNLARPETTTQVTVAYHYKEDKQQSHLEKDVCAPTVASDADFLMGMSTLQGYMCFRSTITGSIYIQELCRQLMRSAGSSEMDDILTILTRVNREVNKLNLLSHKQMPQPYYTLTKKLVLKFV